MPIGQVLQVVTIGMMTIMVMVVAIAIVVAIRDGVVMVGMMVVVAMAILARPMVQSARVAILALVRRVLATRAR